jgi:hypothetical protein
MVEAHPATHVESTPLSDTTKVTNSDTATQTADRLRESLDVKPPTSNQGITLGDGRNSIYMMARAEAGQTDDSNQGNKAGDHTVKALQADATRSGKENGTASGADLASITSGSSFLDKQIEQSATVRRTVAFGEGAYYGIGGTLRSAGHDLTHPTELIEKAATGALIGAGMRVLLPKTGVGKAVVAGVMGYYMVKDAVAPLINGWSEAGKAKNFGEVDKAAQHVGNGLGAFAWDSVVGSVAGVKAEKWTGALMDKGLGTARYAAFERTKVDLDKSIIGKPVEFVLSPLAKAASWASDKMVRKPEETQIEFHEVKNQFAEVEAQHIADVRSVDLHLKGLDSADGKKLGFSQTLDLLEQGHDPRAMTSEQVKTVLGPLDPPGNRVDLRSVDGANGSAANIREARAIVGPTDETGFKSPTDTVPPPAANGGDGGNGLKPPTDKGGSGGGAGDGGDGGKPPVGPNGRPYTTQAEKEVNATNLGKLAGMNKTAMDAWTDKRVLIADATERLAGPVHAAITPEYTKMDAGYIKPRNQMMQIAAQIKTEEDLKYVMPLFSRFSMAATQHISDGLSETSALKMQLDLMALETHSELVRNMKKAGIDPDVVLRSKNPAVFSVSHDGGSGPHTMRQIDGVWNVDHVLYPRNMMDTRSTTASGIYGHELGHDQYGGIAKFDEAIREQVISNAVIKGLGNRVNEKITVPGVGEYTKKDLIEALFKAQADENTADIWGAAWTGHNAGGALGMLLQSLRKGGQLETRNVFGTEFKSAENPFGFEVHAFDALRPKIVAAVMRARANGNAKVLDYAGALERYSDEASKSGDYTFANMDNPGQTFTIPRKDLEDVVPHLIDAQLNTKLNEALQGHSMAEILPDLPANMEKMDILADLMVDAIQKGKKPSEIPFDVSQYKMIQVFGAGLPAALRLTASGMDATEANTQVNVMSDYLRSLYHANDPHVDPLRPSALQTIRLTSPKSLLAGTAQGAREAVHTTGQVLGRTPQLGDWLAARSTPIAATTGVAGVDKRFRDQITANSVGDLMELEKTKNSMLNSNLSSKDQ